MNYGISFDQHEGSFYPPAEFRAAHWFAHQGYAVVAPIGPSSSGGAFDLSERELYKRYFSPIGGCDDPYFLGGAVAWATANNWIIDYMTRERLIIPNKVIVVGQSAGGWAANRRLPLVLSFGGKRRRCPVRHAHSRCHQFVTR
jgi:dienelactone hydrolase